MSCRHRHELDRGTLWNPHVLFLARWRCTEQPFPTQICRCSTNPRCRRWHSHTWTLCGTFRMSSQPTFTTTDIGLNIRSHARKSLVIFRTFGAKCGLVSFSHRKCLLVFWRVSPVCFLTVWIVSIYFENWVCFGRNIARIQNLSKNTDKRLEDIRAGKVCPKGAWGNPKGPDAFHWHPCRGGRPRLLFYLALEFVRLLIKIIATVHEAPESR